MQSLTIVSLVVALAIGLIFIVYIYSLFSKNKFFKPNIIFSKYGKKGSAKPIKRGIVAGTSYLLYNSNNTPIISMTLTCSFMTHLYCFISNDQNKIDQHLVAKTKLSRVDSNLLPADFNVYCNRADETKLKQIFDTQVLSYLSEFCRDYDLEVADNQIVYALKHINQQKESEVAQLTDGEQLYNMVNPKTIEWYKQVQEEFII